MPRYSIIENPGTIHEDCPEEGLTFEQAQQYLRQWYSAGEAVEIRKENEQ